MLRQAVLALTLLPLSLQAGAETVFSSRVYASAESTRVILESDSPISYTQLTLDDPPRLIFDIHSRTGDEMLAAIRASDTGPAPYLKALRASRNNTDRMRIVFDLADDVEHNAFVAEPVGPYRNRLMIDVSPVRKPDPLLDLLLQLSEGAAQEDAPGPAPEMPEEDLILRLLASLRPFIVVIDPGHGGDDPGAVAKSGLLEKNVVLDISRRVKGLLDAVPGVSALLTRDSDYFVSLGERVRKAHRFNADLFVSIHADSFRSPRPMGTSVFVLSTKGASSKFARRLAEQENLSDLVGGTDADFVARDASEEELLKALSFDGKQHASRLLAGHMRSRLASLAEPHGDDIEYAGFAVLKSPSIPSILVETGFLSNPGEAGLLADEGYRQRMAQTIADGIADYHRLYHGSSALLAR